MTTYLLTSTTRTTNYFAAGYFASVFAAVDRPSRMVLGISGPGYTMDAPGPGFVPDKGQRFGPALDLRSDGTHPLRGRSADTAAVIPGGTVAWRARRLAVLR